MFNYVIASESLRKNHCEEEDQEGNNSPEIETLPLFPIHGGSQQWEVTITSGIPDDMSSENVYSPRPRPEAQMTRRRFHSRPQPKTETGARFHSVMELKGFETIDVAKAQKGQYESN
ncbi:hypothetical protein Tco_0766179 [Tanacetum coccineum]